MKKSHNFLVVLIFFLALIGLLFFVYKVGTFTYYNQIVDDIIGRIAGLFGKQFDAEAHNDGSSEYIEEFAEIDETAYPDIDIAHKNPVFCGIYSLSLPNNLAEPSADNADKVLFKVEDYEVRARHFSNKSEWRYITEPCVFGKYFAVFTGEPELQIFNISTGMIYKCETPAYPEKILRFDEDILVFTGRDGETYYFSFTGEPLKTTKTETNKTPKDLFYPDEKCSSAIKSRLDMWTDKKIDKLPSVSFFPAENGSASTSALYDTETGLSVYAYSPTVQGKYKVGFADENGAWSDCSAYVFVFLQDGELLSMSFEYYADKPQVEVNLSDKEIYYFVCGSMSESEIPENTRIAVRGL